MRGTASTPVGEWNVKYINTWRVQSVPFACLCYSSLSKYENLYRMSGTMRAAQYNTVCYRIIIQRLLKLFL